MENKQIYIDGVDVSGCKHYKNRTCIADYCLTDMPFSEAKCELNPNCYYKQLKRKEQLLKSAENHIKDLDLMVHNGEERENELEQKFKAKEQECENNKIAHQMELDIYNQECLNLLEELKAKEQECERLKEEVSLLKESNSKLQQIEDVNSLEKCYLQQLDQLKANNDALFKAIEEVNKINKKLEAENERLKKEIRLYDCIDKWGTEQCHCACRCLGNEFCDAAEEKMKNIKQTLAEINRMAENTYCLTNTTNKDMANFAKQIFQKISECEVDDVRS